MENLIFLVMLAVCINAMRICLNDLKADGIYYDFKYAFLDDISKFTPLVIGVFAGIIVWAIL